MEHDPGMEENFLRAGKQRNSKGMREGEDYSVGREKSLGGREVEGMNGD
jgi:hypothetical protein